MPQMSPMLWTLIIMMSLMVLMVLMTMTPKSKIMMTNKMKNVIKNKKISW